MFQRKVVDSLKFGLLFSNAIKLVARAGRSFKDFDFRSKVS